MGFRIASFNMYKFSNISDDTIKKNMSMIANIIRNEEIDIIALQEIFNQYALERLIGELGNHRWDGAWAKPNSRLGTANPGRFPKMQRSHMIIGLSQENI